MNELSIEQLRDVINALKHYQTHNISLNNPRYNSFNLIIELVEQQIIESKSHPKFDKAKFLEWFQQAANDESLAECMRGI